VRKEKRGLGLVPAKAIFFLSAGVLFYLCSAFDAGATWFVDQKKFHASVHGTFSCRDCHEDVTGRDLHPNPEDMVKKRVDFFAADRCLVCHDEVLDRLEEGVHGTINVQSPQRYNKCFRCHEPHTQVPVQEQAGLFNPDLPRHEQCGVCHKQEAALPSLTQEDEACMTCHRSIVSGEEERIQIVCFHCHGREGTPAQKMTGKKAALIAADDYEATPHANLACTDCHPQAVRFNHGNQEPADCTQCHSRHDEKVAHDLHGLVDCGACHLGGVEPVRDERTGKIVRQKSHEPGVPSQIHDVIAQFDEKACRNCHAGENRIGAAAMILPPKSIICMPCHAATFSIGDTTTILTLLVFAAGIVMMLAYVFTGAGGRKPEGLEKPGSTDGRMGRIARTLILDVLLQRRLYVQSRRRWLIHGLIFYPFVFRFSWGLVGLVGSLWNPSEAWVWNMLDKNNPLTGFFFDLTGIMVIIGVALAWLRGTEKSLYDAAGSAGQDRIALALIAAIVLVGFFLEGMRIAMTGYPPGSPWSFVGYPVGIFWAGATLTGIYGYVWYLHAVLTGAFIAYIPFSRLAHIIVAPVVLAMSAGRKH
jgi:nitrate reductase gamma subunit